MERLYIQLLLILTSSVVWGSGGTLKHDYGDALSKSILFFEGQRSGKLPSSQRMIWRRDSALHDGDQIGVDLVGGYYVAGDNVKSIFPMAFSTTMLAWSVLESSRFMAGSDLEQALVAIRWATDYLLKATDIPGLIFVQVGDPYSDHNCWERPEDMATSRTPYAVSKDHPGSEVAAEIAAALAASSLVFRVSDVHYSITLLRRAIDVFNFADAYKGSYNDSLGQWVCPFYCDLSGYQDELIWAAAWLHKATKSQLYWKYIVQNIRKLESVAVRTPYRGGSFTEFGWGSKHAGINILVSKLLPVGTVYNIDPIHTNAVRFVCSLLPESPMKSVEYSPGGLLFKPGGSNMQHTTALSFLLVAYARHLSRAAQVVHCGPVVVTPSRLIQIAKTQVDYILGTNPLNMSYMVGYGKKFPLKIHHRGACLPSMDRHPDHIDCRGGTPYMLSKDSDSNLLVGAVVGGPDIHDSYADSRQLYMQSEPSTYTNAPLVGLLAYFKAHPV